MGRYQSDSLFGATEDEKSCGHIIRVAFESGVDNEFSYLMPDELWPIEVGQRVEAPFGRKNKLETGFCVGIDLATESTEDTEIKRKEKGRGFKLKKVLRVVDKEPLVNAELMELARWISSYYVCPLGQVLAAMVPAAVKKGIGVKTEKYVYLLDTRLQTPDPRPKTEDQRPKTEDQRPKDCRMSNVECRIESTTVSGTEYTDKKSEVKKQKVKSKKQKQIVEYLQSRGAAGAETAIEMRELLDEVGCTDVPVKKLAQESIVKITQRTVFRALPVIPDAMILKTEKVILNEDQQKALGHINSRIDSEEFGVTLLYGVTDSGKTELYIRAIEYVLKKGKGAIVLLPEIALTAQTVQRFSSRFEKVAVMHSGLTAAQRNVEWQNIKAGQADVVIGARSAIFAPLPRLGLVVVDEEHEASYKQDCAPRYHGRDVAIKRAQSAKAHCILGSATPSLETLFNSKSRKYYDTVRLTRRVMDLPMPEMRLVDLQDMYSAQRGLELISEPLAEGLKRVLARKEQAILLLNRRGYSNFIFCPSCKHTLHCRNCDITLTFHKSGVSGVRRVQTVMGKHIDYGYAVCHYCLSQTLVPEKCPLCGHKMAMIGMGSQKLEEELARRFPDAHVARVDSDSMAGKDYYRVLRDFSLGQIDILAGTQMLAKGLHFPNVTLVGIISADTCLYLPDFRANERTFQLISQVAGRAGRSAKKGVVFVQTFLPEQPVMKFALRGNFGGFVEEELKHRRACNLPPFWRLAIVGMRDRSFDKLEAAGKAMREKIDGIVEQNGLEVIVRGPVEAVISRVQRFHRMQIILQAPQAENILRLFRILREEKAFRPGVEVAVDMDPVNLL